MTDPMRGVFQGLDITASGMKAELKRAEVVAANLANMHSTGNAENEPYRRRVLTFEEVLEEVKGGAGGASADGERRAVGVEVAAVATDSSPFPSFYQPGHPDADASGMVLGSNVDLFQELVDMQMLSRSFDANLTAMRTYRSMLQSTIQNMSR